MSTETLIVNGINGATGDYDLPPLEPKDIAGLARGIPIDPKHLTDIAIRRDLDKQNVAHFGLREGLDPKDLSQAGWGVIFPQNMSQKELDALKDALRPLLDHRREQAAKEKEHYYKECQGDQGYQPNQSKQDFLKVHDRGPGPADPEKLPYYLLIVGDPETIPFPFQYQLDVQYAVGRIHFKQLEDYYRYAVSVVESEKRGYTLSLQAVFYGTANNDDSATQLSAEQLVKPLAEFLAQDQKSWKVNSFIQQQARKSDLDGILRAKQAPALLFTASHGMSFPNGHPLQFPNQGALLCQDWPGPNQHHGPIPEDFYFSAQDLGSDANLLGLVAFFFACFGAGTPQLDDFFRKAFIDRKPIAPHSFLAQLPQRMLSHPRGGALAVVGHVERAWGYSFFWDGVGKELVTFEDTLKKLAEGYPIGCALEPMNARYAELSTDLTTELDQTDENNQNEVKIAGLWTANNDARNYMILGDPAVRLMASEHPSEKAQREAIVEILNHAEEKFPPSEEAKEAAVPVPQQAAPAAPAAASAVDSFGLCDTLRQAGTSLSEGVQRMVGKLTDFLGKAIDDAASLEVRTYVSDDITNVKFDSSTGGFSGAKLRAFTHIHIDGDAEVCVPEVDGEVDTALWRIHMEMLQQAQTSRAELLKTMVSAVSGLATLLKP